MLDGGRIGFGRGDGQILLEVSPRIELKDKFWG
jgi:hypothetical protein